MLLLHEAVPALFLDLVRHGARQVVGGSAFHRRVLEAAHAVELRLVEPALVGLVVREEVHEPLVADLVDVTRMATADPEHRVPHLAFQPDRLSDVPILKRLFSNENTEKNTSELLVVLIPHIIRSPEISEVNLRGVAAGDYDVVVDGVTVATVTPNPSGFASVDLRVGPGGGNGNTGSGGAGGSGAGSGAGSGGSGSGTGGSGGAGAGTAAGADAPRPRRLSAAYTEPPRCV